MTTLRLAAFRSVRVRACQCVSVRLCMSARVLFLHALVSIYVCASVQRGTVDPECPHCVGGSRDAGKKGKGQRRTGGSRRNIVLPRLTNPEPANAKNHRAAFPPFFSILLFYSLFLFTTKRNDSSLRKLTEGSR